MRNPNERQAASSARKKTSCLLPSPKTNEGFTTPAHATFLTAHFRALREACAGGPGSGGRPELQQDRKTESRLEAGATKIVKAAIRLNLLAQLTRDTVTEARTLAPV